MGRVNCERSHRRWQPLGVLLAVAIVSAPTRAEDLFVDAGGGTGLDFEHYNAMSGKLYFVEMMGAGGALLDYDNDGDLDVYLTQGRNLVPGGPQTEVIDQLYRNDLIANPHGSRTLSFTNVTTGSGLLADEYGMGAAAADFDNDGLTDIYVVNFGANQLWRNNGDGTFSDVTQQSGVGDAAWSTGAAFFDFDRNGWLDLYVVNYVDYTIATHHRCETDAGLADYCGPKTRHPVPDKLYKNRGDGSFEEVSVAAGIATSAARGLGVVVGDFDADGWDDLYVANDADPNQLWINQGDGSFVDEALLAGCAVNGEGLAEAGMGVTAGDFDNDGDDDLFVTHLLGETNTLYENQSRGWFVDRSVRSGLAAPSWSYTGFGTSWLDYDNDGWLDLMVMNGEVRLIRDQVRAGDPHPLRQRNQLFHGLGGGQFEEVTPRVGEALGLAEVSRAGLFGDIDNDGDTDVVVTNNGGQVRLLLNQVGHNRSWLGLRALDGARDAIGAKVTVGGEEHRQRVVRPSGSYLASSDPRVLVGLDRAKQPLTVRVEWVDGGIETWEGLAIQRYWELRRGAGSDVD